VFELILANQSITKWFIPTNTHATRSDSKVIVSEVEADSQVMANLESVVGWNIAAITGQHVE
jgi:hypothetical protein